jgi:hypothetical protein
MKGDTQWNWKSLYVRFLNLTQNIPLFFFKLFGGPSLTHALIYANGGHAPIQNTFFSVSGTANYAHFQPLP